jgi:hypothetical protein
MNKAKVGISFSSDQRAWQNFMRAHVAVRVTVAPDNFDKPNTALAA